MSTLIPEIEGFRRTPMVLIGDFGGLVEMLAYRDGADTRVRLRAGPVHWDTVTVRRTGSGSPALWKWWKETVDGVERRRDVLVNQVDDRGTTVAKWTLAGCWPTRWRLVEAQDRNGKSIHVEEMTLAVEALDLA